jgi:hypothetical protein
VSSDPQALATELFSDVVNELSGTTATDLVAIVGRLRPRSKVFLATANQLKKLWSA